MKVTGDLVFSRGIDQVSQRSSRLLCRRVRLRHPSREFPLLLQLETCGLWCDGYGVIPQPQLEMEGVRQELDLVQVVEGDGLPLAELLPPAGSRIDPDGVPVEAGQHHLGLNVDSHVFPRYVGGLNLQERTPTFGISSVDT